ncbi:unnamed protein product [Musa acuminata var. zebrina]
MMIGLYRSMSNIIVDILEDKELDVEFLYSVTWKNIDISFEERILTICFLLDCLIAYWTITKMVISALVLACGLRVGLSIGIAFGEVLRSAISSGLRVVCHVSFSFCFHIYEVRLLL